MGGAYCTVLLHGGAWTALAAAADGSPVTDDESSP